MNATCLLVATLIAALTFGAPAPVLADTHYEATFAGTVVSQGFFEVAPQDQMGDAFCHIRVRSYMKGRSQEVDFWGHSRMCDIAKVGVRVNLVAQFGDSWGPYDNKMTEVTVSAP